MMLFEPTLIVTRVVIHRNELAVYDERFHEGVNVIRGENSSGKSTVLNFIFYGLGGDLTDWSGVALLCSRVTLEVELNGRVATLSREVSSQPGRPMDIYGGGYDGSRVAAHTEWIRYPYRRSQTQESFSQALFRLLGIPEVATDMSGNITIHQILRLLYADQLSPVENIFRFERFDQPSLRDAIGRLLCGAYDSALYDNEQKIRELSKEIDSLSGELRSLFSVLGKSEHNLTLDWISTQRKLLESERVSLEEKIEETEKAVFINADKEKLTLGVQEKAYNSVQKIQTELGEKKEERDSLLLSISDSQIFINSLNEKITALRDSSQIAEHIGEISFSSCPSCYAILDTPLTAHSCHLCKSPFDTDATNERIVALINDVSLQLKQSGMLQNQRELKLQKINLEIQKLEEAWKESSQKLAAFERLPSTELSQKLRTLHHHAGYLSRQVENLNEKAELIKLIDDLSNRKNILQDEVNRLKSDIEKLRVSQQNRLSRAYTAIADETRELLHHDLRRQDSFETAQNIDFSFEANKISVDEQTYFSASSRVILKSSFFLGFLAAATKEAFFRHPRFCIIDTIEDKGMEPTRSHNFQMQIAKVSEAAKSKHQIIYGTAMLAPDLDDERYTVGKFSTRDEPTIDIQS